MAVEDPTSFLGQKVVAVELQEPGLQFFSSPEEAAGTTTAVMQHLQSPSAMDQVAPYFALSPYTAPLYAAYRINEGEQGEALAQLRARIEEAKKWATSSAGLVTQRLMSGEGSLAPPVDFGTMFRGSLAQAMPMFSPSRYQDSISEVLDSIRGASFPASFRRSPWVGRISTLLRGRRRVITVEDL